MMIPDELNVTLEPQRFRKNPVVIDAFQWQGNWPPLLAWLDGISGGRFPVPFGRKPPITISGGFLTIETLEGTHRANVGDWIIRGIQGEFYPCKPDIFEATYEQEPPNDHS